MNISGKSVTLKARTQQPGSSMPWERSRTKSSYCDVLTDFLHNSVRNLVLTLNNTPWCVSKRLTAKTLSGFSWTMQISTRMLGPVSRHIGTSEQVPESIEWGHKRYVLCVLAITDMVVKWGHEVNFQGQPFNDLLFWFYFFNMAYIWVILRSIFWPPGGTLEAKMQCNSHLPVLNEFETSITKRHFQDSNILAVMEPSERNGITFARNWFSDFDHCPNSMPYFG